MVRDQTRHGQKHAELNIVKILKFPKIKNKPKRHIIRNAKTPAGPQTATIVPADDRTLELTYSDSVHSKLQITRRSSSGNFAYVDGTRSCRSAHLSRTRDPCDDFYDNQGSKHIWVVLDESHTSFPLRSRRRCMTLQQTTFHTVMQTARSLTRCASN